MEWLDVMFANYFFMFHFVETKKISYGIRVLDSLHLELTSLVSISVNPTANFIKQLHANLSDWDFVFPFIYTKSSISLFSTPTPLLKQTGPFVLPSIYSMRLNPYRGSNVRAINLHTIMLLGFMDEEPEPDNFKFFFLRPTSRYYYTCDLRASIKFSFFCKVCKRKFLPLNCNIPK